jgi:hypothetical protein
MKPTAMHSVTLCVVLLLLVACTMNSLAQSTAAPTGPVVTQTASQMRPSDQMFYWHEEARELHSMAMHTEQEAELVLKQQSGPTTEEFVKRMRSFAYRLHEAAKYADAQAQQMEQNISPHRIERLYSKQ